MHTTQIWGGLSRKFDPELWTTVDPSNLTPFRAELDDLIRLHFLITSRKVTTVLEFGVGYSSIVFDLALKENKKLHGDYVKKNLRRSNPFECHSVDSSTQWIEKVKSGFNFENVHFHQSNVIMGEFNGRICTYYSQIPNICPDFIYLDGPDQYSVEGEIRGLSTRNSDRLPMSADILAIEHFLLPGTLIVVDGRAANARFLKSNLQRNWSYFYVENYDQHFFELIEPPLGKHNYNQLKFTHS